MSGIDGVDTGPVNLVSLDLNLLVSAIKETGAK